MMVLPFVCLDGGRMHTCMHVYGCIRPQVRVTMSQERAMGILDGFLEHNLRRHPLIGIVTTLNGRQTFSTSSTCCQGVHSVQEE